MLEKTLTHFAFRPSLPLLILYLLVQVESTSFYLLYNLTVVTENPHGKIWAQANFQQKLYETGWNHLSISSNVHDSTQKQHEGIGFLEGYLTHRQIWSAYNNYLQGVLKGNLVHTRLQNYVDMQFQYIQTMIQSHLNSTFWQTVSDYLQQVRYMYRGYLARIHEQKLLDLYIGWSQFYYLINAGDMQDLIQGLNHPEKPVLKSPDQGYGNCNGYVKLKQREVYIAHSTHNIFQLMIRFFKTYTFYGRDRKLYSFSFSSRAGDISSKDDFYVMKDRNLVVFETSLQNFQQNNYKQLNYKSVPAWLRKCVAASLAKNASEWLTYYLNYRSGTHNNQWVISDLSILKQISSSNLNLVEQKQGILFLQQAFSSYKILDMTQTLIQTGYVASYNVPISEQIYHKLGYQKYPYTYENNPRAQQYKKYNALISDEQDMKKYLLMNQNQDVKVGIAPRYDLAKQGAKPFGLTDLKIISTRTLRDNFLWLKSGPSTSNGRFPPFDWDLWNQTTHQGMPKKWDFQWQKKQFEPENHLILADF